MGVKTIVVSDVHIGSRFFQRERFLRFLDALPADARLILNGDLLDHFRWPLPPAARIILERLRLETTRREVIWLDGNHDAACRPPLTQGFQRLPVYRIDRTALVSHGHRFIGALPAWEILVHFVHFFYRIFSGLLMPAPIHPAEYGKRWPALYRLLRAEMIARAVEAAQRQQCRAVICGHSHYAEDLTLEGVRYLNTGSWTESPVYCAILEEHRIALVDVEAGMAAGFAQKAGDDDV
jgi:UDP-2,3-diacylglucosamine pyrophosphatase LpxH